LGRQKFVVSWILGSVIVVAYVEANPHSLYLTRSFAVLWKPEDPPPEGFLTRDWVERRLAGTYGRVFLRPATFQASRGLRRFELVLSKAQVNSPLHDKCLDRLRYHLGLVAVDPDHIDHHLALGCLRRILPSSETGTRSLTTVFLAAAQAYHGLIQKTSRTHQENSPQSGGSPQAQGDGSGEPELNKSVTS